jgi:hypothetical protein
LFIFVRKLIKNYFNSSQNSASRGKAGYEEANAGMLWNAFLKPDGSGVQLQKWRPVRRFISHFPVMG